MIWILEQLAKLPIWAVYEHRGRREHEPYLGKVFIVTMKDIWFFGWTTLVIDIQYLDPKVTKYFLERSNPPTDE